jgi:hypothetical protein
MQLKFLAAAATAGGAAAVAPPDATYTICAADFNDSGDTNSQDFFGFLTAFFGG